MSCTACEELDEREQLYADIHEDGRPPASVQLAAAHDDPRGLGDGIGL